MEDLSLHILDVAENSIRARASLIQVEIDERPDEDLLVITISDDGNGMASEEVDRALDPFYSTKKGKPVGLGLPLLADAAREAGGELKVVSQPGQGTSVRATFILSHVDLKPIGDIPATLQTLITGHPEIDFVFRYVAEDEAVVFDTRELGHDETED